MAVMTAQPPLPLLPPGAVEVGAAAALLVDGDGGRVFVRGELVFAWDDGDEPARQLAAVQLVRVGASSRMEVAQAFGVNRLTVLRWDKAVRDRGVAGLVQAKRGPKGPSKLTPQRVADIQAMRRSGATLAAIAQATGVSTNSAARAAAADPTTTLPAHAPPPSPAPAPSGPTPAEGPPALPVLAVPAPRGAERAAARAGLLRAAPPVFAACARAPLAGLFLALPALNATGLLAAAEHVYGDVGGGFYGRDTLLLEGVLRALAGQPRAEGATRIDPAALGRVLGMDRAPEVKTIRRRIHALAALGRAGDLQAALASHHLTAGRADDDAAGIVLYADGHVRAYAGTRRIGKAHSARLRFPAPATLETWISDGDGCPVLVVMAQPGASLAGELRRLLPDLRAAVGHDRRVLVGFDRGGWSPALFAHLAEHGFDTLTWRKGPAPDIDAARFTEVSWTGPGTGTTSTWHAADTTVDLPLGDTGTTFAMRQITRTTTTGAGARQAHILTTRTDLPAGRVLHLMGSRWRLENYFRYARIHFALDAHDSHRASSDDPQRSVPNPARKHTHQELLAARTAYHDAAADTDRNMLALRTPPAPGITSWTISNTDVGRATAGLRAADDRLTAAEEAHAATPARLPLEQVNPGQQVLDTETKLLTHAIRMAAFNTITALARDIRLNTGHRRAADEAHTLARQALTATGDIHPADGTLTITLDPLPTRRASAAIAELCAHLTATQTRYPGTDLTLRYAVKNQP